MPTLEEQIFSYEKMLLGLTQQYDKVIGEYQNIIAKQQFDVLASVQIFDVSNGQTAVIDLSRRINQLVKFDTLFYSFPAGTTQATITLGRFSFQINFTSTSPLFGFLDPFVWILGQGDIIKTTWTPVGPQGSIAAFGLFGKETGNTQQM